MEKEKFFLIQQQAEKILPLLPPKEQQIIKMRFGLEDGFVMTVEEIAQIYHVTPQRIQQIEGKILRRLRYRRTLAVKTGTAVVSRNDLMQKYPPLYKNHHKKAVFEKVKEKHLCPKGVMVISRWKFEDIGELKQDEFNRNKIMISTVPGSYDYTDISDENRQVWHVNFADYDLFGYYAGDLFDQDEIMTLEHPLLASVAEYLEKENIEGLIPSTAVDEGYDPRPVTVEGVPYWVKINVNPVTAEGKKTDIYGSNFVDASEQDIENAITINDRVSYSNILAISAPKNKGEKTYTKKEVEYQLSCLLAGFASAAYSSRARGKEKVCIHTGNWGCGVFGGNFELCYMAQLLAASIANINEIVFHMADKEVFDKVCKEFYSLQDMDSFDEVVDYLVSRNYLWNTCDGN